MKCLISFSNEYVYKELR